MANRDKFGIRAELGEGCRGRRREIGVYEYVYEYGKDPSGNKLPTYSYTYSYTRIFLKKYQSWPRGLLSAGAQMSGRDQITRATKTAPLAPRLRASWGLRSF